MNDNDHHLDTSTYMTVDERFNRDSSVGKYRDRRHLKMDNKA